MWVLELFLILSPPLSCPTHSHFKTGVRGPSPENVGNIHGCGVGQCRWVLEHFSSNKCSFWTRAFVARNCLHLLEANFCLTHFASLVPLLNGGTGVFRKKIQSTLLYVSLRVFPLAYHTLPCPSVSVSRLSAGGPVSFRKIVKVDIAVRPTVNFGVYISTARNVFFLVKSFHRDKLLILD